MAHEGLINNDAVMRRLDKMENILLSIDTQMKRIIEADHFVRIQCDNARKNNALLYTSDDDDDDDTRYTNWSSYCTIY